MYEHESWLFFLFIPFFSVLIFHVHGRVFPRQIIFTEQKMRRLSPLLFLLNDPHSRNVCRD